MTICCFVDKDFFVELVCSSSISPHRDDVGECGLESIEWFGEDDGVDDDDVWWEESIHKLLFPLRLTTSTSNSSSIDDDVVVVGVVVVVVVSILFVICEKDWFTGMWFRNNFDNCRRRRRRRKRTSIDSKKNIYVSRRTTDEWRLLYM